MLRLISVQKVTKRLLSGEMMQYLSLPDCSYEEIQSDLRFGPHLTTIDNVDLTNGNGIIVKCESEEDGLLAASYLMKKFELQNEPYWENDSEEDDEECEFDDEFVPGDEPYNGIEEAQDEADSLIVEDGCLLGIPIVSFHEFIHNTPKNTTSEFGMMQVQFVESTKPRNPYWQNKQYPIIVCGNQSNGMFTATELFQNAGRFIIYLSAKLKYFPEQQDSQLSSFEKLLMFDCDYELCQIRKPSISYYERVMRDCATMNGYGLSRKLDKHKLIEDLQTYRGINFSSNQDIVAIVQKAIKKKKDSSKTLTKSHFEQVFVIGGKQNFKSLNKKDIESHLDQLIGLQNVKEQLNRVVKKMKLNKERMKRGLKTSPMHTAACFLGAPGTAKTTVSRLFGEMLCSEGVIENSGFFEISRGDLIGKYVGHTAPLVEKVFQHARGGTIFIDEAYSLVPKGNEDPYSVEAMAEIIRQMENNPDTLVIFAGYTEEMKYFIQHANPGLRSRLTNIIQFNDYSVEEMLQIFHHFVEKEEFMLSVKYPIEQEIASLLTQMHTLGNKSIGNGRLMRKLFQSSVGFMAERENDYKTILLEDVKKAVNELVSNELTILQDEGKRRIGF